MAFTDSSGTDVKLANPFGRYRILKRLGRGGMGSVYLAQDTHLDRRVALKVPHFSPDEGSLVLQRFYREAKAAAAFDHPNLCKVYDVGNQDGVPYLTMAYIEGHSLAELLKGGKTLSHRDAAVIVRKIALALLEAHTAGIIHRDLKPSNVMINQRGEPVVMDFGLARQFNQPTGRLTRLGAVLGTPSYMPPEQVKGESDALGPGCDIYSLGVMLYELLTGRVPFEGPVEVVLGQILTQAPQPPSALRPDIDPRLQTICLRAMQKKTAERFASMDDMANALAEYLRVPATSGKETAIVPPPKAASTRDTRTIHSSATIQKIPASAKPAGGAPFTDLASSRKPASRRPRVLKWFVGVALIGVVVLVLGASAAWVTWLSWRNSSDRPDQAKLDDPGKETKTVPPQKKVLAKSDDPGKEVKTEPPQKKLLAKSDDPGKEVNNVSQPAKALDLVRAQELRRFNHGAFVTNVALSSDGKTAVSVGFDHNGAIWDVDTGKLRHRLTGSPDILFGAAITPDGKWAMTSGQDFVTKEDFSIRVWDAQSGKLVHALKGHTGIVGRLCVSSDGKSLFSSSWDGTLRRWNALEAGDSEVLLRLPAHVPLLLDPAGDNIVMGTNEGAVGVLRRVDATPVEWIPALSSHIGHLARVSESVFAVGGGANDAVLIDVHSKNKIWLKGHTKRTEAVDVVPGGKYVVTGSDDETVRVWNASDGSEISRFNAGCQMIRALKVLPDGQRVLCAGSNGTLRLWRLPLPKDEVNVSKKEPMSWADALESGLILAPDMTKQKRFVFDDFKVPTSDLPNAKWDTAHHGYRDGIYFMHDTFGSRFRNYGEKQFSEFACEVVGRKKEQNRPGFDGWAWGLALANVSTTKKNGTAKERFKGIQITLTWDHAVLVNRFEWDTDTDGGPWPSPIVHQAIKNADEFNALLVVARKRQVEIYMNGVAICDPITVDRDFMPARLFLQGYKGEKEMHVEFQRFRVWSAVGLPTREETIAAWKRKN